MEETAEIEKEKFLINGVSIIASAHAVHDTYSGFLAALLPILIEKFSLTNTTAGLLSLVKELPSILQPLIGYLADKRNLRWLVILAPSISGAAMSLLGISPSYAYLIFLVIIAGLSSSSLHAIGPVMASKLSGKQLGKGMSIWMVGGEMGRALGPVIMVSALGLLSLEGLPWLMLGGFLISIFLSIKLRASTTQDISQKTGNNFLEVAHQMKGIMLPLAFILFTRSLMVASLSVFLPTYLKNEGVSLWMAGASLTILQSAGVLGALLAGSLSDLLGRRKILVISYIVTPIFMFLLVQTKGLWQIPFLILTGFFGISVIPVVMAIVLENFPDNRSLANGIYMAVNFLLHALGVLLVGLLSDSLDLRTTFLISAGLIPLGLPLISKLPKSNHKVLNKINEY